MKSQKHYWSDLWDCLICIIYFDINISPLEVVALVIPVSKLKVFFYQFYILYTHYKSNTAF